MDVEQYLSNLPEKTPVSVNLYTTAGAQIKQSAVAGVMEPPEVELMFPPGSLADPERIDKESDCLVFIETGEIVTLICSIKEIEGREAVYVTVRDVIQHVEKREFYRGPAERIRVSVRRKSGPEKEKITAVRGVNISCGGMLMMLNQPLGKKEKLELEIYLPDPVKSTIKASSQVLRVKKERGNSFFVAVKFTDLDAEHCDDIMAFCFAEQRRRLRENVITRDL